MPEQMLNTKEVAEYLGINEKQVYALIKAGRIPCTRVTGKWVFPKNLIDEWIDTNAREGVSPGNRQERRRNGHLLAAGSNDPVLDLLISQNTGTEFRIFTCNTGSTGGLTLMKESGTDIAWCHLFDPDTGEYNVPYVASHLGDKKIAVIHLFKREIGFLVAPEASKKISRFEDLASGVRFINRQQGSGIRLFLDYNLKKAGIDSSAITGYGNEVNTHFEIGLSILAGKADAGISSVAISKLLGLPFVPLVRESFDMVVGKETFFEKGIQDFIETLQSKKFRKSVEPLGDYGFSDSGKILFSSAG
ncbi:MAG TPA: substrate-binding domain-containing protein [Spirochaetota bacterium]|nr:helix-turn-helix domain-containing protein [Spirochaetota bacterium]HOD15837.1 substrate-binding domain-containing protein [Spirochaetota bacterium]HPG51381.1 substrate-binding domain-containing protein [Spirochaetota bacterium]HPN11021.1 substrate-binding domain-containing protein [Spirochaetota bacterium]